MGFAISRRFWSASEAWTKAQRAMTVKVRGEEFRLHTLDRKESRWQISGERYLRGHRAPKNQLIRVDPKLQEVLLRPIERIAPALSDAFDKHLGRLAFAAWRRWPVYSGLSKSLIALEYTTEAGGDRFVGSVRSRAPYTFYIDGQPHRALIDKPARLTVDKIAADAIKDITRNA